VILSDCYAIFYITLHLELDLRRIFSIFHCTKRSYTISKNVTDIIINSDSANVSVPSCFLYDNLRYGFSIRIPYIFSQYEVEIRESTVVAEQ